MLSYQLARVPKLRRPERRQRRDRNRRLRTSRPHRGAADQRWSGPVGGGWPTAKTGFVDAETNPHQVFRPTGGATTTWSGRIVCNNFLSLSCESRSSSNTDWQPKHDQRFILKLNRIGTRRVGAQAGRTHGNIRASALSALSSAPETIDHRRSDRQPGYSGQE